MFVKTYGDVIGGMAISADAPEEVCIRTDDPNSIIQTLKERIADRTQMVVVIVSSKRKDRYDAIKRICCLELPVPSQVVTSAIIEDEKKRRSVVTKVAIQMNCKLGGEVMMTNIPIKNIMICGIDTYHDSQKKKSSVCAFIATSNQSKTKFYSRASIQETHQELSSNLTLTFKGNNF
jgi:aubergine-like protein